SAGDASQCPVLLWLHHDLRRSGGKRAGVIGGTERKRPTMDRNFILRVAFATSALAVALPALTNESATAQTGTIPQGIWELNQERSSSLHTGKQTLWIVKDDRRSFVWA